ncbi:hypothetical protein GCM10010521_62120 [Streptomyces rameus]|uniref:Uncharacterized protein n=1 Tax=Streptomyces rameus TaxID=68261 RepID=A0ABP6HH51_9ACTN
MTIETTATVAEGQVVALPVDHTRWTAWLAENTEADWRPDEWDATG